MKTIMKTLKILILSILASGIFLTSCQKDAATDPGAQTVTTVTVRSNVIDTTLFFKGTINGTNVKLYPDTIYTNFLGDSSNTIPMGHEYAPYSFIAKANTKTSPTTVMLANSGGIAIVFDTTTIPTNTIYRNIIKVKSYSYGKLTTNKKANGISGARVFYIDANGVEWTTDKGVADQTGSTFAISYYMDYSDPKAPGIFKKVKASFSCKVYDGLGNSKTISNGSFSGKIITW
jgi:hypothetical protein